MRGARWVQERILEPDPDAELRVLAVWMPMLVSDSRARAARVLEDPRVTHVWDKEKLAGRWFARRLSARRGLFITGGVLWDSYVLLGPDRGLLDAAGPVTFETRRLQAQLRRALSS